VVGDGEVVQAHADGGGDEVLHRDPPVPGAVGVVVQVAAQVGSGDEVGQLAGLGAFELAVVLPQLRRDPRQVERGVDVLLALGRHDLEVLPGDAGRRFLRSRVTGGAWRVPAASGSLGVLHLGVLGQACEHVLVEGHPPGERSLAEPDVVGLGAGEVQQCGAEARRRHHPQVDLDALPGEDGGLGRSGGEHAIDVGEAEEPFGDLGGLVDRGRDQHVDVADVAPEAAHAAGVRHLLGGIELVERRDDAFGHGDRHVQLDPLLLGRPRSLVDGLPQVLRRLLPRPGRSAMRPSSRAARSPSRSVTPSSVASSSTVLGPSPGTFNRSRFPAGCLARSSSSLPIVPVSTYSRIRLAMLLPIPRTWASSEADRSPTSRGSCATARCAFWYARTRKAWGLASSSSVSAASSASSRATSSLVRDIAPPRPVRRAGQGSGRCVADPGDRPAGSGIGCEGYQAQGQGGGRCRCTRIEVHAGSARSPATCWSSASRTW
jgi:hypothetical protein